MLPVDASTSPEAELLLLLALGAGAAPRSLTRGAEEVWDTLAIAEYLAEIGPRLPLLPRGAPPACQHCRAVCGEMHSGFRNLRSALPMNLGAHFPRFKVWAGAQPRHRPGLRASGAIASPAHGGPHLFGPLSVADAMFAPVAARFRTYDVKLDPSCARAYRETVPSAHGRPWPNGSSSGQGRSKTASTSSTSSS